MSKPEWKDAPKWAEWLAKDKDGFWWWYEAEPFQLCGKEWVSGVVGGKVERASRFDSQKTRWKETLERRP